MNVQEIQEKFFREGKLIAFPKKLKSRQDLFAYLYSVKIKNSGIPVSMYN